ncbi:F-box/kelch-repeat protein At1g57790-like isoform X3 [Tasmannia lanceolata]|uniref:F-box/kelch-repeat protein At1g57790-like isoform X3 n=1 Tax=Tasmannia lanceolata TaxID=3420 RepID=UPI004063E46F
MPIHLVGNACSFFNPIGNTSHHRPNVPNLAAATVYCSKDSWLLMSQESRNSNSYLRNSTFFFFNPFTKCIMQLPNLNDHVSFEDVAVSSSPTSLDCKVLLMSATFLSDIDIYICCCGDKTWTYYKLDNNNPWFCASYCNPVFYDEVLYVLGMDGRLAVFNPKRTVWSVLPKPTAEEEVTEDSWKEFLKEGISGFNFLVESNGKLVYVSIGRLGRSVDVFCLNHPQMMWEKLNTLEDKTLFLSRRTSFSVAIEGMKNKIIFPRLCGEDCSLFYSLDDSRFYPNNNFYKVSGTVFQYSTRLQRDGGRKRRMFPCACSTIGTLACLLSQKRG